MSFFKRKQSELKTTFILSEIGVAITFRETDGKNRQELQLPMSKEQIQRLYKFPGFERYIAWEDLFDSETLQDGLLPYEMYYKMINDGDGIEILRTIGLPVVPAMVSGTLHLESLPQEAKLRLDLADEKGRNLDRIGRVVGALVQENESLKLLPETVYRLKSALLDESYQDPFQKVAVCQGLAHAAGIRTDSFLEKERYHVIDQYDIDIKVHSPEHIELVPRGEDANVSEALRDPNPRKSFTIGERRERYVRSRKVSEDLESLMTKRHIHGDEVPTFLENPSAILPEFGYMIDLEAFSERVRGILPIQKARPRYSGDGQISWFDTETGNSLSLDESLLRELMEKNPDKQYVNHEGTWIYLDPTLRKKLLEEVVEEDSPQYAGGYVLDIMANEEQLDYSVSSVNGYNASLYPLPGGLNADLFQHQLEGYQWLCRLLEQERGGLLADDMGLGKTLQVIAFLLRQQERNQLSPTLLVLPLALIENWRVEINKFAPALANDIYVHHGNSRLRSSEHISRFDLVLTSYDTLKTDQLIFGRIRFRAIICDEAQNIKSHTSQRSRALRAMQSEFRLAMTGTPVENSLDELWAIMDFVQPGCLNSLKEFRNRYEANNDYEGLLKAIEPHYMRRTKKLVLADRLPQKIENAPIYIDASSVQRAISHSMLQTKETGQVAILNMLTKLRQLYGHPGAIIPDYEGLELNEVPKLEQVIAILDRVKERGEKALLFTEFRRIHSIVKRVLMHRYGISVPIIDGDTPNRQSVVQQFNTSQGFGVMLLSQKAAGVGLTITSANHVIHYTRWWNPAVENQATDRAYRIGQEKDVHVHHIITRDPQNFPQGTVEELMHELLESKREMAENVIVPFDVKDIKRMLESKLAESIEM